MAKAMFGAGCFWGVEAAFQKMRGVAATAVGYSGGTLADPSYADVCDGRTGHTEVVDVTFDPAQVAYEDLLALFWDIHDPTTPNRQGPDIGDQYRSAIYYVDAEQEASARASKEAMARSGRHSRGIVTEITAASTFYPAEDYHQKYFEKRGIAHGL
jgi:peptide-methionine (S)-S-oxide reductase